MKSKPYIAYCTFPDEITAQKICNLLVSEDIIACANILGPMHSIYKWEGKIIEAKEWSAILKTSKAKAEKLKEKIRETHPYSNPCVISLGVEDGLPDFLEWICKD